MSKAMPRKNYLNHTVENFKVLKELKDPDRKSKEEIRAVWECQCILCNKIVKINSKQLRLKQFKRKCDCEIISEKRKNYLGTKLGHSVITKLLRSDDDYVVWWLAECPNCNYTKEVCSDEISRWLRNNIKIECVCVAKEIVDPKYALLQSQKSAFKKYKDGDLTLEQFVELASKNCYYCGVEPQNCSNFYSYKEEDANTLTEYYKESKKHADFKYNGLDRVDNSRGHYLDNVVPCCIRCNWAKGNKTVEQFKKDMLIICEKFLYLK